MCECEHQIQEKYGSEKCMTEVNLDKLADIQTLLIHQAADIPELCVGYVQNNKYRVQTTDCNTIFYAIENNTCWNRSVCGHNRAFDMNIMDTDKNMVIHLFRQFSCCVTCFPWCVQKLEVSSPPGKLIGTVEKSWALTQTRFICRNACKDIVLTIIGPWCKYFCFGEVVFNVFDQKSCCVAIIAKRGSGFFREIFSNADDFTVSYEDFCNVELKAIILAAVFLIDFVYFENKG